MLFNCPTENETFETTNVSVTDEQTGQVILKARDECPHCGQTNHIKKASVEEVKDL